MQIDKTTLTDLSIFLHEEEHSVFHHLNFTRTNSGKEWLRFFLGKPLQTIDEIRQTQQVLQRIITMHAHWPFNITNGTIMVMGKFYETSIQEIPSAANFMGTIAYKAFNGADFSLVKYSVLHFTEFVRGMHATAELFTDGNNPPMLQEMINRIRLLLSKQQIKGIILSERGKPITQSEILRRGHFFHRNFKDEFLELIEIYSRLDAYYSMATACKNYQYVFPELIESHSPFLSAQGLYHPLLKSPVAYDVMLTQGKNFLFLTGANMGGKSTFIKSVGVAVYLAHIGMGVPAKNMQLSLFGGLLSNIQVEDNIAKGESFFFNEVQRVRKTIEKISDGKNWLILIDELFKGTNVQDAMRCSTVVIEGLLKMKNTLFILSTHLYEIGEDLKKYPNIQFRFFETEVQGDQLLFSYHLKEGISNDRLGYLILKREGVVAMLQKL